MPLSAEDVGSVLGPTDEDLMAEILATDATVNDLAEAWAWINADSALIESGRPPPAGRVAELVDLLIGPDEDDR